MPVATCITWFNLVVAIIKALPYNHNVVIVLFFLKMKDKVFFDLGSGIQIPMLRFYIEWVNVNGIYRPISRVELAKVFRF